MSREHPLERFRTVLFENVSESTLTGNEYQQLIRYRDAFTQSLDNPLIRDTELRDYLMSTYHISESQAYRDLANIRILLGNVRNAGKEWIRYLVIEGLKDAAKRAKDKSKLKEEIMALDKLAKYNRLDKEDNAELPFDKIIPVDWETTSDVSVLGVKPMENLDSEIEKLYKKYMDDIEIEDIDYQEVDDDGND